MKMQSLLILLSVCGLSAISEAKTITVSPDGTGDFKTVQEAVNTIPDGNTEEVTIHIKPGTYAGQIIIPKGKDKISLEGEDAQTTKLTWDRNVYDPKPVGADKFNPGIQVKGNDFHATGLTFENTAGDHGQALAMRLDADRGVIIHCRIVGWQDTLMANNGRDYIKDSYITGRVDFIYGSGTVWLENCEIHSRNGGFLTAASTPQNHPFGFVFNHCKISGDAKPWDPATTNPSTTLVKSNSSLLADLGRPWRPYASVTYLNCEMGNNISPKGWNNWGNPKNETTARYAEYNSTGPGANPDKRVTWAKRLTKDEADKITVEAVLGGDDHWNPETGSTATTKP